VEVEEEEEDSELFPPPPPPLYMKFLHMTSVTLWMCVPYRCTSVEGELWYKGELVPTPPSFLSTLGGRGV